MEEIDFSVNLNLMLFMLGKLLPVTIWCNILIIMIKNSGLLLLLSLWFRKLTLVRLLFWLVLLLFKMKQLYKLEVKLLLISWLLMTFCWMIINLNLKVVLMMMLLLLLILLIKMLLLVDKLLLLQPLLLLKIMNWLFSMNWYLEIILKNK